MKPQERTKACLFLRVFMVHSGWFWKVKVTKSGDPYTELVLCIYPSQVHTHRSENTHHEHTPRAVGSHLCCSDRGEVGGHLFQ